MFLRESSYEESDLDEDEKQPKTEKPLCTSRQTSCLTWGSVVYVAECPGCSADGKYRNGIVRLDYSQFSNVDEDELTAPHGYYCANDHYTCPVFMAFEKLFKEKNLNPLPLDANGSIAKAVYSIFVNPSDVPHSIKFINKILIPDMLESYGHNDIAKALVERLMYAYENEYINRVYKMIASKLDYHKLDIKNREYLRRLFRRKKILKHKKI